MANAILSESRYAKLVKDIRGLVDAGKERALRAARQETVLTYWEIGKRITKEGLTENAGYGDAVLADLSEDLSIDAATLTRCVSFFKAYNLATSSKILTWSHYKMLIPLRDAEERAWYEFLATTEHLDCRQLRTAIENNRFESRRTSKRKTSASGTLTRPTKAVYLYKALVKRVVDGDTLLLMMDLGFTVWKEQRVRLAGIDTPPLGEPKGQEACKYVQEQLAKTGFVMVKTNKIDIYGRYIGHIFYALGEQSKEKVFENGRYLNQELLDKGLAKLF